METVNLICIKVNNKLRVRITSNGYKSNCNCQFPRKLRVEGRRYVVPIENVNLVNLRGTYYYRISSKDIKIIDDVDNLTVFGSTQEEDMDCAICMDNQKDTVFGPCGHFNCCRTCADHILKTTSKCPICRSVLTFVIDYEKVK